MIDQPIIQLDTTITQAQDLLSNNLDDEIVMMNIEKGAYYGLDAIASHIWTLIETPISVSDLCDALLPSFDVDLETCRQDVLAFLHRMHKLGTIVLVE
jgi:hypothetical protein